MTNIKPNLGRFGVFGTGVTPDQAKDIEALGYGAVWVAGSPPAELDWVEPILDNTTTLQVATGVINIWSADAGRVAESFHRIEKAHPGRFLLGIAVGHPEADEEFRKPIDAINDYLDKLDEYGVPKGRRVLAALGPQLLKLSARRTAGTHPANTTPEHTAQARQALGPDAFIAPAHKAVLTTDAEKARAVGRKALDIYLDLTNYLNSLKRLGFTDDEPHQARQRPPRRCTHLPTAALRPSRRASPSTSTPAPTMYLCKCSPNLKTSSRHSPNWPDHSA
jgi:probable F420-dependent oxidoreductase